MTMAELGPAEAIAASLCWLARFRHGEDLGAASGAITHGADSRHRPGCRVCGMAVDDLITTYSLDNVEPGSYKTFMELSRLDRADRIREAQEVQWYDTLSDQ